ncbi:MAG: DUF4157 domain-containing protein [Methanosarcinales archaeon]|nr:DUF4157 domain-containing protein [Methanosarcinales archaeon]
MRGAVAVAKEADRKQEFSPTTTVIHHVRDEHEMQLGSLGGLVDGITRNGGTPSVESIATELGSRSAAERTPALLALQQTHGNLYVQRVVAGIQAKLVVGQPRDIYEQEADRVADEVMWMPEPEMQRQIEEEEEEVLQPKFEASPRYFIQRQEEEEEKQEILQTENRGDTTPEVIHYFESQIQAIRGGGQPLSESERAFFEPRFGVDFGQVKVHAGTQATESAQVLNARAYTLGQDVVFGEGQYAPETISGRRLMAHELTHVVQQNRSIETPAIQRWPRPTQRVIDAPDPTEEVPHSPRPYVRYVIEPDDPSAQVRDLRLLAQLSELARFPHIAHVRWHSLSREHQHIVFWEMGRHYGQNFALQFWQHANAGRFDYRVIYTDMYRIEQEGIQVPLDERGSLATEMGYQFTGAGLEVGLLYNYELWVHPSGKRIEFHPPAMSEEEMTSEDEVACLHDWYINWRQINNLMGQEESEVRVNLISNDGVTYEVLTRPRTTARSFRPDGQPYYELYTFELLNTQTGISRTVNLPQLSAENFNTNYQVLEP